MGMVFEWRKEGYRPSVDAQVAGEALEGLGAGNIGAVKPQAVVDAARPAEHVLHPAFEWDDHTAAEAHRRQQARMMIGALVTVTPEQRPDAEPIRAFVNVTRNDDRAYVSVRTAMSDADLRAQVLSQAMRELVAWRQRHRELEELAGLFTQIDWIDEARRRQAGETDKNPAG